MKNSYIYANGQMLCEYEGETDPNRYLYIHDRLGSVRLVISEAADANNSYTYTPFGELFATESTETAYNPFKFTGFQELSRPFAVSDFDLGKIEQWCDGRAVTRQRESDSASKAGKIHTECLS